MAAIQLSFTLRTSPNCKTVHLVGNWDGYKGQLPLSKDASKAGAWKGTFRFQGATLKQGQRYWYYYVMDGYHVSHDPAREFTTEPTTGRKLNILDVPAKSSKPTLSVNTKETSRRHSKAIAQGRGVSPSRIVSPRPQKPSSTVDNLTRQLAAADLSESESESEDDSDCESDVPSLSSSRSSACSSPSSAVSSSCSCHRFGITRKGDRVRLDCGGSRCGGSDEDCSDSEEEKMISHATRRQGVVIRNARR
jgi:hypothetical protein